MWVATGAAGASATKRQAFLVGEDGVYLCLLWLVMLVCLCLLCMSGTTTVIMYSRMYSTPCSGSALL
jgi:hypothetical protein